MLLEEIRDNSTVFIDANIFLYSIAGHRKYFNSCKNFLNRIENKKIKGVTSVIVLNELLHKLIIGEVAQKFQLKIYVVFDFIKQKPEILSDLKSYEILNNIEQSQNFEIIKIEPKHFTLARNFMKKYFLLSNDALHLAVMKEYDITNLASNDSDFERVGWINLCKPKEER